MADGEESPSRGTMTSNGGKERRYKLVAKWKRLSNVKKQSWMELFWQGNDCRMEG